jgi:hypothetical protein
VAREALRSNPGEVRGPSKTVDPELPAASHVDLRRLGYRRGVRVPVGSHADVRDHACAVALESAVASRADLRGPAAAAAPKLPAASHADVWITSRGVAAR